MAKAKSSTRPATPDAPALIPAVGYLRRSTKFKKKTASGDETENQKNSIPRQKAAIERLAADAGYRIVRWYTDDGKSGWKRGAQRPEFARLMEDAGRIGDFQAVLVDDLDRFSRDEVDEVISDLSGLARVGVTTLHSVAQGPHEVKSGDIGKFVMLSILIWGGNEESRRKARRVAETRAKLAREGLRSGGRAPYGMANDGAGGLTVGDPAEVRVVRSIYSWFADDCRSMAGIAKQLTREGVPGPQGGKWSTQRIKEFLQQEAYAGVFTYNKTKTGDFFFIGKEHQLIDAKEKKKLGVKYWQSTEDGIFRQENAWPAIVPPEQFKRAQRRLKAIAKSRRKPHDNAAPLSGILVCGHCNRKMYAARPKDRKVVYRCSTPPLYGECHRFEIREELILPAVLKMLREEIDSLKEGIHTLAPRWGRTTGKDGKPKVRVYLNGAPEPDDKREILAGLRAEAERLNRQINDSAETILTIANAATRKRLDDKIAEWQEELDRLNDEIATREGEAATDNDCSDLIEWVGRELDEAVRVPLEGGDWVYCRTAAVREALFSLGAEITLRWDIQERVAKTGKRYNRYTLKGGRFKLGVREGTFFPEFSNASLCTAPPAMGDRNWFAENVLKRVDRVFGPQEVLAGC